MAAEEKNVNVADLVDMIKSARKANLTGNYDEALELVTRVLQVEPNYEDAIRLREQVEEFIRSGDVPVHKLPEQARLEFNTALSLERAGRFDDARARYQSAQGIFSDPSNGDEKRSWPAAFDGIQRMDRFLIADKSCEEASKLVENDKWDDAIVKYSHAIYEYGDNLKASLVRQKVDELQATLKHYIETCDILYDSISIDPLGSTKILVDALSVVSIQISRFPGSKKWKKLEKQLRNKIQDIKKLIIDQKNFLIKSLNNTNSIAQTKSQSDELLRLLKTAVEAWDDEEFSQQFLDYRTKSIIINKHWNDFNEARQLLRTSYIDEGTLRKIQSILAGLRAYSLDLDYLMEIRELKRTNNFLFKG